MDLVEQLFGVSRHHDDGRSEIVILHMQFAAVGFYFRMHKPSYN